MTAGALSAGVALATFNFSIFALLFAFAFALVVPVTILAAGPAMLALGYRTAFLCNGNEGAVRVLTAGDSVAPDASFAGKLLAIDKHDSVWFQAQKRVNAVVKSACSSTVMELSKTRSKVLLMNEAIEAVYRGSFSDKSPIQIITKSDQWSLPS